MFSVSLGWRHAFDQSVHGVKKEVDWKKVKHRWWTLLIQMSSVTSFDFIAQIPNSLWWQRGEKKKKKNHPFWSLNQLSFRKQLYISGWRLKLIKKTTKKLTGCKHLAECQVGNQYRVAHKRLCRPQVPMMKTPGCQKQGLQSLVRLSLRTHIYESHRENWSSDLAHINDSLWTFVHE